jgi:DNA modification methylase
MSALSLPSPKQHGSSSGGNQVWYRFYAMFSEDFARSVLGRLSLPLSAVVLDPWVGTGTTCATAGAAGLRAVGVDINPVMVTVARGRLLDRAGANKCVTTLLDRRKRSIGSLDANDPLLTWFGRRTATAVRGWERAVSEAFPAGGSPLEAGFLLTCLFDTVTQLTSPYRTKNPTWLKKPDIEDRVEVGAARVTALFQAALTNRQLRCLPHPFTQDCEVHLGSSTCLPLGDGLADLVLTSPPYCTRIDYAVSTAVELSVLGSTFGSLHELRDRTMGTSTIRGTPPEPMREWGVTCLTILDSIKKHPSKASKSYYNKNYLQYFDDLYRSLTTIARCTKAGGNVVIVAQDSVYKGIHVDLPRVIEEMGGSLGLASTARDGFPVTRNMRQVNTRSRRYLADATSTEAVIWMAKLG